MLCLSLLFDFYLLALSYSDTSWVFLFLSISYHSPHCLSYLLLLVCSYLVYSVIMPLRVTQFSWMLWSFSHGCLCIYLPLSFLVLVFLMWDFYFRLFCNFFFHGVYVIINSCLSLICLLGALFYSSLFFLLVDNSPYFCSFFSRFELVYSMLHSYALEFTRILSSSYYLSLTSSSMFAHSLFWSW